MFRTPPQAMLFLAILISPLAGCSPLGEMVTVNGRNTFAKPCIRAGALRAKIEELSAARRKLGVELGSIQADLSRVRSALKYSETARRRQDGDFECRAKSIPARPPSLACTEDHAAGYGWILCWAAGQKKVAQVCQEAQQKFPDITSAQCRDLVRLAQGKGRKELEQDLQIWFLEMVGDSARKDEDYGPAAIAQAWALSIRAEKFQGCVDKLATSCLARYKVWSLEKDRERSKEALESLCEGWRSELRSIRAQESILRQRDSELVRQLTPLQQEYREVIAEIRQDHLRC